LLLHTLKNVAKNQAVYDRALNGLDENEKIQVKVKLDYFENEAREFARHNLIDFYKSPAFAREFKLLKGRIY
jgi:hypothetical protein